MESDLSGSGIDCAAGDSFGVFPVNDPGLVAQVLEALHAPAIAGHTLAEVLAREVCLKSAPDALFTLISYLVGGERKAKARALANGEDLGRDAADVLAALTKFPGIRPDPEALIECRSRCSRGFIPSSSPRRHPRPAHADRGCGAL